MAFPTTASTYIVTGTDAFGCVGFDTVTVNMYPIPVVAVVPMPSIGCGYLQSTMNFTPAQQIDTNTIMWSFDNPAAFDTSGKAFPWHLFTGIGVHEIRFTAQTINGCNVAASGTVSVNNKPVADFYFNPEFAYLDNPQIHFANSSVDAQAWYWNFGDPNSTNNNTSNQLNPLHLFSDTGVYEVRLLVENGLNCADTAIKQVPIYLNQLLFVPNAFTPNSDQTNDVFKPVVSGIEKDGYSFIIFDRWGKKIFLTTDYNAGWDGLINDKQASIGIYTYKITYREIKGKTGERKGIVTLVR